MNFFEKHPRLTSPLDFLASRLGLRDFYKAVQVFGLICSLVMCWLFLAFSGWNWLVLPVFLFLLLGIEFGAFAAIHEKYEFGG